MNVILSIFFFLLVAVWQVAGLLLIAPAQVSSASVSLVEWIKESTDPCEFAFDVRFVSQYQDYGLAFANVVVSPEHTSGVIPIQFPSTGSYVLAAVTGDNYIITRIGFSNAITVLNSSVPRIIDEPLVVVGTPNRPVTAGASEPPPTIVTAGTGTAKPPVVAETPILPVVVDQTPVVSSTTSSASSTASSKPTPSQSPPSPPSLPKSRNNTPVIIGGVIGAIVLLTVIIILFFVWYRRRMYKAKIYDFHRESMVQRRTPTIDPAVPRLVIYQGTVRPILPQDLEATPTSPARLTLSGTVIPAPRGPRLPIKQPRVTFT